MSELARLGIETRAGVVVAALDGELDMLNVGPLGARLVEAASTTGVHAIVVDLSAVTYLDSSTVHLLFGLQASCRERNATLRVVAPPRSRARRVLGLAGMETVMPLAPTVEDAIRSLDEPVDD